MALATCTAPEAVRDQLQRSLQRGRLAHAYLLAGPRGSGKEAVAAELAKALNCLHETGPKPRRGAAGLPDACDACDSCRRVDERAHPDIHWIRPESKSRRITVGQVRDFEQAVGLKPTMARVKVGVVVDADCLGEEAGNAFLKTLEEPPAQTVILLLTTEPQRLLPTILSRCLRLNFGAGTGPARRTPEQERVRELLASFATPPGGRVAAAYQLLADLGQVLEGLKTQVRTRVEADMNLDRYEELEPKVREKLEDIQAARIEGEYRDERARLLEELYGWFADVLLAVERADPSLFRHGDRLAAVQRAAGGLGPADAMANVAAIEGIRDALQRNVTEPFALEVGLLKLRQAVGPAAP